MSVDVVPPRQAACLRVIQDWVEKKGFTPTLSEIAVGMNVAKPTAQSHVGKLIRRGLVVREEGRLRLGSVPSSGWRTTRLADLGADVALTTKSTTDGGCVTHPVEVIVAGDRITIRRTDMRRKVVVTLVDGHFSTSSTE